MIKFRDLGMFATAKNDPTVKAHAAIANGYLCTIAAGATVALPDAATAKVAELKLALLHHDSDEFAPAAIASGAYLTAFDVAAWAGQHLIVDSSHVKLAGGTATFADLEVGDIFVACDATTSATDAGKFLEIAAATGYNIWFSLEAKTVLNGVAAIDLLVHVASVATVVA
jgi:hypothetical protein